MKAWAWASPSFLAGMVVLATAQQAVAAELVTPAATVAAAPKPVAARARPLLLGLAADVGIPDGAILSVVVRPRPWARLQLGAGNNSISWGWRLSASWLPFRQGPSLDVDYGRYAEGNANALARRIVGPGFHSSRLLDRVGYEYVNVHLGLNFGFERIVFFVQGGVTVIHGEVHNLDQVVGDAAGGSATVVVHEDPTFRGTGVSAKAGLIAYVW